MKIVAIAARRVRWPIAPRGAARDHTSREALLVELLDDRGTVGLGEAAPLPGTSRDTLADAEAAVAALAARLPIVVDTHEIAAVVAALTTAPAARFALETALFVLAAGHAGVALSTLLGGTTATLPCAVVVDTLDEAREAIAGGAQVLKLKVTDFDLARIEAFAALSVPLRLDANRAWPIHDTPLRLAALAHLSIEFVEEPCRDARLLRPSPIAIALDESLADDATIDARLGAVILKPTLLGGLVACIELARAARAAGVAAIVTHCLEGPVGTAACAELALALGGDRAVGLAPHPALVGWRIAVPQVAGNEIRPSSTQVARDLAALLASAPGDGPDTRTARGLLQPALADTEADVVDLAATIDTPPDLDRADLDEPGERPPDMPLLDARPRVAVQPTIERGRGIPLDLVGTAALRGPSARNPDPATLEAPSRDATNSVSPDLDRADLDDKPGTRPPEVSGNSLLDARVDLDVAVGIPPFDTRVDLDLAKISDGTRAAAQPAVEHGIPRDLVGLRGSSARPLAEAPAHLDPSGSLSIRDAGGFAILTADHELDHSALRTRGFAVLRSAGTDLLDLGTLHSLVATPTVDTLAAIYAALDARAPIALHHHHLAEGELARQRAQLGPLPPGSAVILFTSGSTGPSRGVVLSRAALVAACAAHTAHLGWRDDDRWLLALSLAHAGGLAVAVRCLAARRPVVFLDGDFDPERVARLIADRRVTLASLVPAQLAALLDIGWRPPGHLRAVLLGGAAASPALLAAARDRGIPFLCTYGMTETFGQVATALRPGDPDAPLVPLPGVELAADPRIRVRAPMLATCYLDGAPIAPELVTADLGTFEGGLRVTGRADDVIITGGENVHPLEVEAIVTRTPGVRAACAFAISDQRWGQVVGVALAVDAAFDRARATAHWHAALPAHARPRRLAIVDALPLLATGKPDRRAAALLATQPIAYA